MCWRALIGLLALGCGEQSGPPPVSGGSNGPINATGISGGPRGASDAGAETDGEVDGGAPTGACDSESDLEALARAGSVRDVSRDCAAFRCNQVVLGSDNFSEAHEACVTACVDNDVLGLSSECAACYGALERCGLDAFCRDRCAADTCNPMCLDCLSATGCREAFDACRGLTGAECAA